MKLACLVAAVAASLQLHGAQAQGAVDPPPSLSGDARAWPFGVGPVTPVPVVPGLKLDGGAEWVGVSLGITLDAQTSWRKWPSGRGRKIIYSGDHVSKLVLTMHHVRALGFWVMPEAFRPEVIEVTLPSGETLTRTIDGNIGPALFGLTGARLRSARISDLAGGGFAIGSFSLVAQDRSREELSPGNFPHHTNDP